jgi:NADH dehydrogenase
VAQDKRGRIEVNPFLKCIGPDPNSDIQKTLFAIGDNACFYNPKTGHPEPGTAPLAIGQGKAAAKNIYRDLVGKPGIPYNLKKHPFVITLGGKCAIAQIGPFRLFGLSAWVLKHLVELHHFLYIHPGPSALRRWWRSLEIYSRND